MAIFGASECSFESEKLRSVMEDHKKFVCKFCNKRYPCGKSLGGHLRSHRISRADDTEIENGFEASGAYVLRENRRKTWRIADSGGGGERFCKECGKGFQSMKALCGHMACHSEKEKQLIMDSDDSDSGNYSGPRRGKRSRRLRYKNVEFDHSNGSSSVSEIEQEQEEVARCLMMLSRDNFGHGKGLNSFGECSDNNSVVLEAKSSSIKSNEVRVRDNSDSGYARNCAFKKPIGENKPGFGFLDAEVEKRGSKGCDRVCDRVYAGSRSTKEDRKLWDLRHEKIENAPKISKFGRYAPDITSRDRGNNNKVNACSDSICESGENSIEADSFSVPNPGSRGITINSSISSKAKVYKSLISKGNNKVDQAISGKAKKRLGTKKSKGHECPICFRVFKSGQALGGHKRSHFIGGSDDRTVVVLAKQEVPDISSLLDLNLPAPDEEGNAGFGGR